MAIGYDRPLEVSDMAMVPRVPSNVGELEANLRKLHAKQRHIETIKANDGDSRLEVDLGNLANRIGGAAGKDFYVPIKRGKLREAKALIDRMMAGDDPPSRGEAEALFAMIDKQAGG